MKHGATFDRMSVDPLWWEFTDEERSKVDGFMELFGVAPGDRVLEPGCGTGRLTELLAKAVGPSGRVLACDTSPAMIGRARARDLGGVVEFACAPVLEVGASDHWDATICFNVLPHLLPMAHHLRTMRGWLRPGASLWICHSASRKFINEIHTEAGMPDHQVPTLDELRCLLDAAGLAWGGGEDLPDRYWALGRAGK
jgi:demethylmenaquinone methyltransferase/2-methoxy-6-polyprenyl-1,4-benzoquinol methylase